MISLFATHRLYTRLNNNPNTALSKYNTQKKKEKINKQSKKDYKKYIKDL